MSGRIIRRRGGRFSVLDLDPAILTRMNWLGRQAEAILRSQDLSVWLHTDPDALPRLIGGAVVLQRMSPTAKNKVIVLQDDGAHLALDTCCSICLTAKSPDPELRSVLEDSLSVITMCCPSEVTLEALPVFSALPETYQKNLAVLQQYRAFPPNGDHPRLREVMLSDALILFKIFSRAPPPPPSTLAQLEKITAGLRLALQRLREAAG